MTPAVVLGSGLGALGALRLLRRAGVPVYSLNAEPSYESSSRWFRRPPGMSGTLASGVSLAHLIETSSLHEAVLLPCSDRLLCAVGQLPPELAARFPSSTAPSAVVTRLTNKAKFAALIDELDVPHPRTLVVGDPEELEGFADAQSCELFLKPVDSGSFMLRYGVKACHVSDLGQARAKLMSLRADGHGVLVQEYVPGPVSNHFLIDGFATADGEIRALFARQRLRMYPPDFGDSTHMISVPLSEVEPALRALRTILAAIAYRGIFSAEFKRDARDGTFKILEINARVWIYVEFAGRCGVDVCTMAYRDALGMPLGAMPGYRSGVRLVSPLNDFRAARHAWSRGLLSKRGWLQSWLGAQQPHFNWSDPAPALRSWWVFATKGFRRLLRRDLRS